MKIYKDKYFYFLVIFIDFAPKIICLYSHLSPLIIGVLYKEY